MSSSGKGRGSDQTSKQKTPARQDRDHILTSSRPEEFEGLNEQIFGFSSFASSRDTVQIKGMGWAEQRDTSLLKTGIQGKKPKDKYQDMGALLKDYQKSMENMHTYHNDSTAMSPYCIEQYMRQSGQQSGVTTTSEQMREQDSLSVKRQNLLRQKEQQQHTTIRSSDSPQVRKTHFFDNRSKYLPLKRNKDAEPHDIIKHWFASLSLADKCAALTVVDKDLVDLFRAMYLTELQNGHHTGRFTTELSEARELYDPHEIHTLKEPYTQSLVYIKKHQPHQWFDGFSRKERENREKEQAYSELVENVRVISVQKQNDALTLDVELISNADYFKKIMKLVDDEFMKREYKISKESQLQGSLLFNKEEQPRASNKYFFHVSDQHRQIYAAHQGSTSAAPTLQNRTKHEITLAKCILLTFEKCISVHFHEAQEQLTQAQKQQFFLKEADTALFSQDMKYAQWWTDKSLPKRRACLDKLSEIERELVVEYNAQRKMDTVVHEAQDEDSRSDEVSSQYFQPQGLQTLQCEDNQVKKQRRNKKDRQAKYKDSNSSSQSSGLAQLQDYSRRDLLGFYGHDPDYDIEAQQPLLSQQNELFGKNNVDNTIFKSGQNLKTKGLQADSLQGSLHFVKQLALWKSLEYSVREDQRTEEPQNKSVSDLQRVLHRRFYKYLGQCYSEEAIAELIGETSGNETQTKSKKKASGRKRKANRKQNAAEETKEVSQSNQPKIVDEELPIVKQTKQNREQVQLLSKQLGLVSFSGSIDIAQEEQPIPLEGDDHMPEIQMRLAQLEEEFKREELLGQDESIDSVSTTNDLDLKQKIYAIQQTESEQTTQLMDIQSRLEKILALERLVDQGVSQEDSNRLFEELLGEHPMGSEGIVVKPSLRYQEERVGLLSGQFQPDKYPYPDQHQDVSEQSRMLRYVQSGECYSINTVLGLGDSDDSATLKLNEPDSDDEQIRAIQAHIEKQEQQMQSLKVNVNPILQQLTAQTQQKQSNKSKRSRKRRTKQSKTQLEPPPVVEAKPVSINVMDIKSNINLSDVEDLTEETETVHSPKQLTDQPRKNNFFRDDHSGVSSSATTPVKPLIEPSTAQLQSQSKHLQEISGKLTQKIIKSAVSQLGPTTPQSQKQKQPQTSQKQIPPPQPLQQPNKLSKKQRKQANKEKNQQQQPTPQPQPNVAIMQNPLSIFSKLSQKPPHSRSSQSSQLDLNEVKIPHFLRSPSLVSFTSADPVDDAEHQKTLAELDSLFTSDEKSEPAKHQRSATVGQKVSAFPDLNDELEDSGTVINITKINACKTSQAAQAQKKTKKSPTRVDPIVVEQIPILKPAKDSVTTGSKKKGSMQTKQPQKQPKQTSQKQAPKQLQTKQPQLQPSQPKPPAQPKKQPLKPAQQQFESYDSMFQNVYGAPSNAPSVSVSAAAEEAKAPAAKEEVKEPVMVESSVCTTSVQVQEERQVVMKVQTQSAGQRQSAQQQSVQVTKMNKKQQRKYNNLLQHQGVMVTPHIMQQVQRETEETTEHTIVETQVQASHEGSQNVAHSDQQQQPQWQQNYTFSSFQSPAFDPQQYEPQLQERGQFTQQNMFLNHHTSNTININMQHYPSQQQQYYLYQHQQQQNFAQAQYQYAHQQPMFPPHMYPQQHPHQFYNQYYPPHHAHQPQLYYTVHNPLLYFSQQPQAFFPYTSLYEQHEYSGHPASIRDHHEMAFHKTLGDQLLQLTKIIDDALDEAAQARQHCFDLIRNLATNTFPELALSFDVYGSMTTKLAIDSSDMDIAIYGIQQEARTAALQELSDKLKQYKCVRHNQPILTASVPVVKLELSFAELAEDLKIPEIKFGKIKSIKIDLVIHDQHGQQEHQTQQCAKYIQSQMKEHPFLKPITVALKKYLTLKGLNSPFQGSVSSYGLVLMVLALIKDLKKVVYTLEFQNEQTPINLGRVFTQFLLVYGNADMFNENVVISSNLGFEQATDENTAFGMGAGVTQGKMLFLQDPIDPTNNVGRQMYNFFSNVQEQLAVTRLVIISRFSELQQKMAKCDSLREQNFCKLLEEQNQEITQSQEQLLSRIIMVDLADPYLAPITKDSLEEQLLASYKTQKVAASIFTLLDPEKSDLRSLIFSTQSQHSRSRVYSQPDQPQ